MRVAFVPGRLALPSKNVGTFTPTGDGVNTNCEVGAPPGGRMTPSGSRRMSTAADDTFAASRPIDAAMTDTRRTVESAGGAGCGGAVYTTRATPSLPMTTVRAESVP